MLCLECASSLLLMQATQSEKGSLLGLLHRTSTAFGFRCLQQWVRQPLADAAAINARLDAVEMLASPALPSVFSALVSVFKSLPDLEKGYGCGLPTAAAGACFQRGCAASVRRVQARTAVAG
jgi:DNA mismatch repair ATPase MutS